MTSATLTEKGTLYIIATPIGNLGDISARALDLLNSVDYIFAEDTRHSSKLLQHYGINTRCSSFHQFNETTKTSYIVQLLQQNSTVAIIADAGTPLISDPGYKLIRTIHQINQQNYLAKQKPVNLCPIPGACALITALSCSGLATDNFLFTGFLPAKTTARQTKIKTLAEQTATLIFYEAPHRLMHTLKDIYTVLGDRETCVAKELTKIHQNIITQPLSLQIEHLSQNPEKIKGEYVILVAGLPEKHQQTQSLSSEQHKMLSILQKHCGTAKAAEIASEITGISKKQCYKTLI